MQSFKPKPVKKIKNDKKIHFSLDVKHNEFLNTFEKDENDKLPQMKFDLSLLQDKLNSYENGKISLQIEHVMEIKDNIFELKKNIHLIQKRKIDYFLDNSKYIFDYFENKKKISQGEITNKNTMLNSFFKINPSSEKIMDSTNNNIFSKYLSNIDDSFLNMDDFVQQSDICNYCFKGELIPMDDEGVLICNVCFRNIKYLIENDKPSYKEPPKEVCFYAYKKINHFKEILAQFQGKETTLIPIEVIDNLKNQIKKERIHIQSLTYNDTKLLLKKLGYNKYYEHINFIKDKLGIKPPIISQELEDTLCNFFIEIQYPYAKHCPDYRVNFLHYYYVLYKLFELIGETSYLKEIPLLKDREKLIEQDTIWSKICFELNWEFIPTI
jgi:hypothetical protein